MAETLTVGCGATAAALGLWLRVSVPDALWPPASPLAWPVLDPAMVAIAVLLALPALIAPRPTEDAG